MQQESPFELRALLQGRPLDAFSLPSSRTVLERSTRVYVQTKDVDGTPRPMDQGRNLYSFVRVYRNFWKGL